MKHFITLVGLDKIGEYNYLAPLTGGQMSHSAIYENSKNEKMVVKFLIYPRNDTELRRFYQEAKSLKTISDLNDVWRIKLMLECQKHPNFDIHYFAMEHVEGVTLKQYFESNLPLSIEKSTKILFSLGVVLSSATSQGIVHRDLHPGNVILLDEPGESDPGIRIIDFGVSHSILGNLFPNEIASDEFRLIGAMSTWSPELLNNPSSVWPKHDVWGLGIMYYRMLTGKYPFSADCFGDYYKLITNGKYNTDNLSQIKERFVHHLIERMFDVDENSRIGLTKIGYICQDYFNGKLSLLDGIPELKEFYFESDGDIWTCPHCLQIVRPNGNRCSKCGVFVDSFLPFEFGLG